jgi:ABC-type transport system substrate-binding protein
MTYKGRRRSLSAAVVAGIASLVVASCSSGGAGADTKDSGAAPVLRYVSSSALLSFDPRQSGPTNPTFLIPVYDSLMKQDEKGELEADLATKWTLSSDSKTLELSLRPDVKFQDGAAFDANAVKANLEAAKKPGQTTTASLASLSEVNVTGPLSVQLVFSRPSAEMPEALAGEPGMMISPSALGDAESLKTKPVGAGPFTVTKYTADEVVYRAWDGYWNKDAIKLSGIDIVHIDDDTARLNALKAGQYDAGLIFGPQVEEAKSSGLEIATGTTASMYALQLNTGKAPFDDPLVRQALQHAIDRDAVNKGAFDGGAPAVVQPFPPGYWANVPALDNSGVANYDPAKAKQLLAQAGLPNGFSFDLLVGTNKTFNLAETIMQEQLAKIGIKMKINIADTVTVRTARRNGNFQASFASVLTGRPTAVTYVDTFYTKDGSNNPGHFSLPGLDEQLLKLQSTTDPAVLKPIMADVITRVTEAGPPVIPLLTQRPIFAHSPKVKGLVVPINYNYDLTKVSIDK